MKISRNWLNTYLKSDKTDEKLVDLFTQLGLECTFEKKKTLSNNIVVGKVLSCTKHPNADRLKICKVDLGNNETVEIVCGAPNIDEKLTVPVAKIGSEINDFEIKTVKIRDVVSNGMICSGKELNINDEQDGIMILDNSFKAGTTIANVFNLEDDTLFDFDITPNRGDCFSHLGIARELSIIEGKKIHIDNYDLKDNNFRTSDLISVDINNDEICDRYACRVVKNIKVNNSPQWLVNKLSSIEQSSINNIVDLANYIMFDLGQPIHVFDYDKIKDQKIIVRYAQNNEKIKCIDNETRKLSNNDIIISDSEKPLAIAGVIGGLNSHVDESTKNILIESAVFNEINIRRTSKKYDSSTEASKRFERGIDSSGVIYVLDKFCAILNDLSLGEISSDSIDIYKSKKNKKKIKFDINNCNSFLGSNLSNREIEEIFSKLNIDFKNQLNDYKCFVPTYRNDLSYEIDLYEEIARVYGYNNIKPNTQFTFPVKSFVVDMNRVDNKIKLILSNNGFNEHYSNSLYSLSDCNVDKSYKPIKLINPLNQEMKYLRNSLLPGLLRALSFNEKRGNSFIKLFELGNVSSCNNKNFNKSNQFKELMIVWSDKKMKHWNHSLYQDIYTIKGEIEHLFDMMNIKDFNFKLNKSNSLNLFIGKEKIGYLKKINNDIKKKYNLSSDAYISSIKIDLLNNFYKSNHVDYNKINSFPSVNRDISILVNNKFTNEQIENVIHMNGGDKLSDITLFDLYKGDKLPENSISLAYSLTFKSNDKTLTDIEVDKFMTQILIQLKDQFGIVQR